MAQLRFAEPEADQEFIYFNPNTYQANNISYIFDTTAGIRVNFLGNENMDRWTETAEG